MQILHKNIKKETWEGILPEVGLLEEKDKMYLRMVDCLREDGYSPLLDQGPHWSTQVRPDGSYDFTMSVYGIYVGKAKAWDFTGVDSTGRVWKHSMAKTR